ncbi:unnamed protein product [Clavelina lepadiformis]|uniref:Uncharacterized protein n=1 Tax=Clavelina lepadiformis TaxID=159417 RepID=A0ABP0F545_CLALP
MQSKSIAPASASSFPDVFPARYRYLRDISDIAEVEKFRRSQVNAEFSLVSFSGFCSKFELEISGIWCFRRICSPKAYLESANLNISCCELDMTRFEPEL